MKRNCVLQELKWKVEGPLIANDQLNLSSNSFKFPDNFFKNSYATSIL